MNILRFLTLLCALALSCLAGTADAQTYRIQPGDQLRIEVLQDASLNRDVLVAPDGRVSVPFAGTVSVGEFTINQAQRRVTTALESDFATRPTVLVSLLQLREPPAPASDPEPLNVFIIGEVNKPGQVQVEHGTTLLQTLSQAGGLTDFAAVKRIQLRRIDGHGNETVYQFNYKKVLEGQAGVGVSKVHDGDVVVVPARRLFE